MSITHIGFYKVFDSSQQHSSSDQCTLKSICILLLDVIDIKISSAVFNFRTWSTVCILNWHYNITRRYFEITHFKISQQKTKQNANLKSFKSSPCKQAGKAQMRLHGEIGSPGSSKLKNQNL